MKTLSEQIKELQDLIVATKDKLVEATKQLQETPDDATEGAVVELTATLEKSNARLASLQAAEKALGTIVVVPANATAVIKGVTDSKAAENLLGKLALCTYESRVKGMPMEAVVHQRFAKDAETLIEVVKAVQNPAQTTVPAYAGELLTTAFAGLLDELRTVAILPKCVPLMRQHTFSGSSTIHVPYRTGTDVDAAGTFRAEGAPIPVKGLTFSSRNLTPKNLGVILTATEEMLQRSSVNLASYFQSAIVMDTADSLDYTFVDTTAGSVIRPAGIRAAIPVGDTRPATGTGTTADIVTDLKVMLTAMANAKMGKALRWMMAPNNWYAVSMALTATGALQFPETANGMLAGYPVIVSQKMPTDEVLLVEFGEISCAFGNPMFLASNVATIHEETVPAAISTVGTPNVVAAPVRSLYQTNSWALRMMMDADWSIMRDTGVVQQLTAVAWA